jgi:proline iminopeptidase
MSLAAQTTTLLIASVSAKLFTLVYPKHDAETVILLLGGPGVPMDFSPIAEPLSRKYQVIAFEQRGTGRSPVTGGTSLLGMLGLDKAYQSLFNQVLENYMREIAPAFTAIDAMVENVRAEPIKMTRACILDYPPLKDSMDYRFPIVITYVEKDIYGKSKQSVRGRFPKATFVDYANAGHIAWTDNNAKFIDTLTDFYQLS